MNAKKWIAISVLLLLLTLAGYSTAAQGDPATAPAVATRVTGNSEESADYWSLFVNVCKVAGIVFGAVLAAYGVGVGVFRSLHWIHHLLKPEIVLPEPNGPKPEIVLPEPNRPELEIVLPEHIGTPLPVGDTCTWQYHLTVKNVRGCPTAKNCNITTRRIERLGDDGKFKKINIPIRLHFTWGLNGSPTATSVRIDQSINLCRAPEKTCLLVPNLDCIPIGFGGNVKKGQRLRYWLDIEADDFRSKNSTIVDITLRDIPWKGYWPSDRDTMAKYVDIKILGNH